MEVYLVDMLVKSKRRVDHEDHLRETFEILRKYKVRLNLAKCAFDVGSGKFLGFMVNNRRIKMKPIKIQAISDLASPHTTKEIQNLIGMIAALSQFVA